MAWCVLYMVDTYTNAKQAVGYLFIYLFIELFIYLVI